MAYTPRLTSDGILNNPKWYSENPFYLSGYGMPNCTCYAWGRFWEIADPNNVGEHRPTLSLSDAKNWYAYTSDGYERGDTPKLGAVICFDYATTGHVAVVEEIRDGGEQIVTSNSDYSGTYFYTQVLIRKPTGKYNNGRGDNQGFIYNPYAEQPTPPTPTDEGKKRKFPFPVAWHHWQNFKRF